MSPERRSAAAFAPGGVGNIGPGLDILGLALAGVGDTVRAEWTDSPGIQILDPGHPDLPTDSARHTSGLAARAVIDRSGRRPPVEGRHCARRSPRDCRSPAGRAAARHRRWRVRWR